MLAMAANAQYTVQDPDTVYTVHFINQEQFKDVIADWGARDWVMKSQRPVVVDFYADWCAPCRRLQPILRDIAHHYQGTVDDTDIFLLGIEADDALGLAIGRANQ